MTITPEDVQLIVKSLADSDWDAATVTFGDVTISVSRNGVALPGASAAVAAPVASIPAAPVRATVPASAPVEVAPTPEPPAASVSEARATDHTAVSPSIGVFWAAPQPGAPAFVEVGARVAAGDTLCIVEVMKLMNNITSDVDGVVTAVHCANAEAVEYGTPLVSIRPDAS